jgi:hypothetical protein
MPFPNHIPTPSRRDGGNSTRGEGPKGKVWNGVRPRPYLDNQAGKTDQGEQDEHQGYQRHPQTHTKKKRAKQSELDKVQTHR